MRGSKRVRRHIRANLLLACPCNKLITFGQFAKCRQEVPAPLYTIETACQEVLRQSADIFRGRIGNNRFQFSRCAGTNAARETALTLSA